MYLGVLLLMLKLARLRQKLTWRLYRRNRELSASSRSQ
jgi:hypothetical protein